MSASVSIDGLGGKTPQDVDERVLAGDEIILVNDIEIVPDELDLTDTATQPIPQPTVVADDVLDGFQDPIMPFVILGIASFLAIVAIAAFLAL